MNNEVHNNSESDFFREFVRFTVMMGITVIPVIMSFDYITDRVRRLCEVFITPVAQGLPAADGRYTLEQDFVVGLEIAALIFAFSLFFSVRQFRRIRQLRKSYLETTETEKHQLQALINEKTRTIKRLQERLDTHRLGMNRVYAQLYNESNPTKFNISALEGTYKVLANADTEVEERLTLRADHDPVIFWKFYIQADPHSTPVESIEDMTFKIEHDDDQVDIEIFVLNDDPKLKKVLVWFLPEIPPGSERTLRIQYCWPKLMGNLLELGSASYFWYHRSRDTGAPGKLYAEFRFDREWGELTCKNIGYKGTGTKLHCDKNALGTKWILSGNNTPLGNTKYELLFQREKQD